MLPVMLGCDGIELRPWEDVETHMLLHAIPEHVWVWAMQGWEALDPGEQLVCDIVDDHRVVVAEGVG